MAVNLIQEIVQTLSGDRPSLETDAGIDWLQKTMLAYFKKVFLADKVVPPSTALIINRFPGTDRFCDTPQLMFVLMPGIPSVSEYIHNLGHLMEDSSSPGFFMGVSMWVTHNGKGWVPTRLGDDNEAKPALCVWFDHCTFERKMWVRLIDVDKGEFISTDWEENEFPPAMQLVSLISKMSTTLN